MDGSQTSYTQEEVNEILRRALAQGAHQETLLTHDDLVEIADEAGIPRTALDQAMADLAQEHMRELARKDEAAELAAERRVQLNRFIASLFSLAAMNAFLYLMATRVLGGSWWVWPLLGSGALLTLKLRHVLFPYDKLLRSRRRERRQREREQRAALRAEWGKRIFGGLGGLGGRPGSRVGDRLEVSQVAMPDGKAFEIVVQKGVSALLAIAERKLDEHQRREKARLRHPPDGRA